ncbi:estradiol 17-beta-dehydrogenase 2-like isoform X2 [Manacus candei]|uniref:estradiol 17-beta-dehydrogenase 2-like isoform X2 n=1 Tax=Manacus candei TaxID=415023 RepID=UPI0022272D06|nr:estradiol 17-beta-dehydrogenase 2-like isoform X2 [Manacus candei]XP_051648773.1 estradiol 17-beta-dehydrogenase 2-like isoform X2 [Manacus candei]
MIFLLQHFFLLAVDLVLAMTLSCLLYAMACISIAFLTCFVIIFSFGTVERHIDVKGKAVVVLVSNSSIGRMFARNLDKAGFRVSAAHWPAREKGTATEECSSNTEVAQLHMTEDEYQKAVKTFVESHLALKGMYGTMKKPSILIWEEGAPDTCGLPETRTSCQQKKALKAPRRNCLLQPVLCVTVLFRPLTWALTLLRRSPKLLVLLLKPKN